MYSYTMFNICVARRLSAPPMKRCRSMAHPSMKRCRSMAHARRIHIIQNCQLSTCCLLLGLAWLPASFLIVASEFLSGAPLIEKIEKRSGRLLLLGVWGS